MRIFKTEYRETIDGFGAKAWHVDVLVKGATNEKPFFVNVAHGPLHNSSRDAMVQTRKVAKQYAGVALSGGRFFA